MRWSFGPAHSAAPSPRALTLTSLLRLGAGRPVCRVPRRPNRGAHKARSRPSRLRRPGHRPQPRRRCPRTRQRRPSPPLRRHPRRPPRRGHTLRAVDRERDGLRRAHHRGRHRRRGSGAAHGRPSGTRIVEQAADRATTVGKAVSNTGAPAVSTPAGTVDQVPARGAPAPTVDHTTGRRPGRPPPGGAHHRHGPTRHRTHPTLLGQLVVDLVKGQVAHGWVSLPCLPPASRGAPASPWRRWTDDPVIAAGEHARRASFRRRVGCFSTQPASRRAARARPAANGANGRRPGRTASGPPSSCRPRRRRLSRAPRRTCRELS